MQKGKRSRRRGFTLIETVVTVGIVAALAAVVYPAVVKQFDIADPSRVAEDLNNIRTALSAFGVNVRPHQPDDLEDLVNRPRPPAPATEDYTIRNATYSAADTASWLGPYLNVSIPTDTTNDAAVISTGFGAKILNNMVLFADSTLGGVIVNPDAPGLAAADFVAVRITGLSFDAFVTVNEAIDGTSETTETGKKHSGRLRCPGTITAGAACATVYFLIDPIR